MRVSTGDRLAGAVWGALPFLGPLLSSVESAVLADSIRQVTIRAPIYVAGLARSGTTLLLEVLNSHSRVAAHHYADYRMIWTPYWWNRLRSLTMAAGGPARERAHGDRIFVTFESPEAFEEVFWMHFFPGLHTSERLDWLSAVDERSEFTRFLRQHIAKLLLARGRTRYLAKSNYHLTRLPLLLHMFGDAKIVVPVREPASHVASLMRQDVLFSAAGQSAAVRTHMRRVGHFEFGRDKQPLRLGARAPDADGTQTIADWAAGRTASAYARQWAGVYGAVLDELDANRALASSVRIVRYEDLCAAPAETLQQVLRHCELDDEEGRAIIASRTSAISAPDYYDSGLSGADRDVIHSLTARVAARLGY